MIGLGAGRCWWTGRAPRYRRRGRCRTTSCAPRCARSSGARALPSGAPQPPLLPLLPPLHAPYMHAPHARTSVVTLGFRPSARFRPHLSSTSARRNLALFVCFTRTVNFKGTLLAWPLGLIAGLAAQLRCDAVAGMPASRRMRRRPGDRAWRRCCSSTRREPPSRCVPASPRPQCGQFCTGEAPFDRLIRTGPCGALNGIGW